MDAKKAAKVTEIVEKQAWRKVWESDTDRAHNLRRRLADAEVYPTGDLAEDRFAFHDAVIRGELPGILAELDRADLRAIHDAARLLAIVPRDPAIFAYIERKSALALAAGGIDPRKSGLDPEALGVAETCAVLLGKTQQKAVRPKA